MAKLGNMNLFEYMDYRTYLKEKYAEEKAERKHFSFRYFARVAGFSSPGYLKMVMDGERNLSPNSIQKFAKAFKFNKKESAYFEALVLFNQAKEDKERDHYFERLSSLKPLKKLTGLKQDQLEYFTQNHFVIIREMVALPHFKEDPIWISKQLRSPLKPSDIAHALEVLLRIGLLDRNEKGKLIQKDSSLSTPAEIESLEVYNYHRHMLNEAKEAILNIAPSERDVSALTLPIPKSSVPEIKNKILAFREEIIDMINKGDQNFSEVYQINVQLFPVTKKS